MKKTAIVLGATGLVGSNLIEQLIEHPPIDKIIAITRRPINYQSDKVENHVVNFDRITDYKTSFTGDVLFSCLGTTRKQAGSITALRRVDFEYQLDVASLAANQGVEDYFLISSSGANPTSLSPYLKMKGQLEAAITKLPFKSIRILQPSLLLGDRVDFRIAESVGSAVLPMICTLPGLRRYMPIKGQQVAQKMIEIFSHTPLGVQTLTLDEVFPANQYS